MNSISANPAPGFAKHPDHQVQVSNFSGRVIVTHHGRVLAETENALRVEETGYQGVFYVPGADLNMDLFKPSTHSSYCPFKGHASYLNLVDAGELGKNITWGYEAPYDESGALKDHWAFYTDRVTVEVG